MESSLLRINEKNKTREKINLLKKTIERIEKNTLKGSIINDKAFIEKKIEKNNEIIRNSKNEIQILENRLDEIDSGLYDSELIEESKNITESAISFQRLTEQKNHKRSKDDFERQQTAYKAGNELSQERFRKREILWAYERYITFEPKPYIIQKLRNMPNNEGFIICGNHFYGHKEPQVGKPLIMTEIGNNRKTKTYEYNNDNVKIYINNVLVSEEPRRRKMT